MEFIVGTALAGVPIVLEVYDRYWKVSDGVSTFRRYSGELTKLDTIMKTQKTLFRGNVIKLLEALTDDEEMARNLLSDNDKEKWETLKLPRIYCANRLQSLREMFGSWEATLNLVHESVTGICLEVEKFRASNPGPIRSSGPMETLKQMRKRFRLCWKREEVQGSIRELRDFTADFNELTARIIAELKEIQNTTSAPESTMRRRASQLNSLERYRQIRSASCRLYNIFALRWSCERHQSHAANISLMDNWRSVKSEDPEPCVKFDVAIDCDSNSTTCQETPIWLEVEAVGASSLVALVQKVEHSSTEPSKAWAGVMETITQHSGSMVIHPAEKARKRLTKKAVRVQRAPVGSESAMPAMQATAHDDQSEEPGMTSTTSDPMIDLEMIEDFCRHFQIPQPMNSNACVGYINDLGLHRFYLPSPGRQLPGQQKSLEEIITWVSEDEISRNLPRTTIASLACFLAAAVLQYHSTPWLPDTWTSSHVRFFGIGELSEDAGSVSSTTPYLRVEFSKPDQKKGRLMTTAATNPTETQNGDALSPLTPTSMTLARNELLFRYGTVLLELGYSQPWPQLQQRMLKALPPHRQTDYHAAEKLAQAPLLCSRKGPRFTTIVRKCLGCDFGLGENDLANEQLQGVFLADVVGTLQQVERGLKELETRLEGF